jgi:hypothetical protein
MTALARSSGVTKEHLSHQQGSRQGTEFPAVSGAIGPIPENIEAVFIKTRQALDDQAIMSPRVTDYQHVAHPRLDLGHQKAVTLIERGLHGLAINLDATQAQA